jgi:1-acyl-sn-glycerol-3-phosphate acyltransferase
MNLFHRLVQLPPKLITYIVVMILMVPFFVFLMRVLNRTVVYNRRYLQHAKPPFLFVSNHVSMLDDAFIGPILFLPRAIWDFRFIPYHVPEKKNFFKGPFFSFVMWASKCVPVTRGKGVYQAGINKLIKHLREGNVVHIYPEGTRTRTGEIGKAKMGVGRLVRESGAKVIPCYHSGLEKVLPIGHKIPRMGQDVKIIVGEEKRFDEYMSLPNTPKTWQLISERCIDYIRELREKLEEKDLLGPKAQSPDGNGTLPESKIS